jgi:hypothetical protein
LLFNGVLTVLFNKIEKKLDYYKVWKELLLCLYSK